MKEACLYEKLDFGRVHCHLCAHQCRIEPGKFGLCAVRQNIDGVLYSRVYGKPAALHVDPIEKKPLYHFLPGSRSFSLATRGCNFRCGFCQNWEISQFSAADEDPGLPTVSPQEIVRLAKRGACASISYTYTEPTIFFEYAYDIAKLAKPQGIKNVFVTNGYMSRDCLAAAKDYLDAANVDLKFFRQESYRRVCAGSLQPVLDTIGLMHEFGVWVEVTTLIIPGENDSDQELADIAGFIAGVNVNIPWHISRFHPDYRFTEQSATPVETIKKAQQIGAAAGLKFVYAGNVSGFGSDTLCPSCGKLLIKREGFSILENKLKDGACGYCSKRLAGIF